MTPDAASIAGETDTAAPARRWPEALWYALVALATVAGEFLVLQLWRADLRIPFSFSADAVGAATSIKGMIENGWIWLNPSLGAPGVMNTLDFPGAETLNYLMLKLLSVSGDTALTMNLYFLLSFPLIALSAAWTLRRLGISRSAAFAASILYAFLPFHLLRQETHLFLGAYFLVPPLCYLATRLWSHEPALLAQGDDGRLHWRLRSRDAVLAAVICVLAGSAGVYYAVFGCFFIGVAAIYGWWRLGERARLLAGLALIGVIFISVVVNLSPYIAYRFTAPAGSGAVERSATGPELYSLRTSLMVLPVRGHRVGLLAFIHEGYVHGLVGISPTLDNEGDFVSLGSVGTLGLLFLLLVLLFGIGHNRSRAPGGPLLEGAATLTGAALLLANSAMFGSIIGVVFPVIRAYNRIVVFVAFFALLAVAVGLDRVGLKLESKLGSRGVWAFGAIAVAVAVLGVADQTTPAMVPPYEQTASEWDTVGEVVARVEAGLQPGAQVFQLPFVPFPEYPPVNQMVDYDHLKPYLRSGKIHWSYGAIKGREASDWNAAVAALPPDQLVSAVADKGFAGVWVDRYGYADGGTNIAAGLATATGVTPIVSADGRYAYFSVGR